MHERSVWREERVREKRQNGLYKESSVDREERKEDKNMTGHEVEAEGGALDEMGGVLLVPICRRENSKLRELATCMYALYMTMIRVILL